MDYNHKCIQTTRLRRIEAELAALEARRRTDVDRTRAVLQGLASEMSSVANHIALALDKILNLNVEVEKLSGKFSSKKKSTSSKKDGTTRTR